MMVRMTAKQRMQRISEQVEKAAEDARQMGRDLDDKAHEVGRELDDKIEGWAEGWTDENGSVITDNTDMTKEEVSKGLKIFAWIMGIAFVVLVIKGITLLF